MKYTNIIVEFHLILLIPNCHICDLNETLIKINMNKKHNHLHITIIICHKFAIFSIIALNSLKSI